MEATLGAIMSRLDDMQRQINESKSPVATSPPRARKRQARRSPSPIPGPSHHEVDCVATSPPGPGSALQGGPLPQSQGPAIMKSTPRPRAHPRLGSALRGVPLPRNRQQATNPWALKVRATIHKQSTHSYRRQPLQTLVVWLGRQFQPRSGPKCWPTSMWIWRNCSPNTAANKQRNISSGLMPTMEQGAMSGNRQSTNCPSCSGSKHSMYLQPFTWGEPNPRKS